ALWMVHALRLHIQKPVWWDMTEERIRQRGLFEVVSAAALPETNTDTSGPQAHEPGVLVAVSTEQNEPPPESLARQRLNQINRNNKRQKIGSNFTSSWRNN
ncbi:MAG: hypothetical protein Q7J02_11420, partial [Rhodocyclaceae bacterium]|nr:hypothetical protein [Rhodocyclaceae bacterium]